jgi:AraC family transcriptional regulator of adaptative response/methylated-DNA-[protein]-cysteine methyltransferase
MTQAQTTAGFASSSGFRSAAKQLLGASPGELSQEALRDGKTRPVQVRGLARSAGNRAERSARARELLACEWQSPLGMMMIVIVPETIASDQEKTAAQLLTLDWIDRKGLELELQRVRRAMGTRGEPATIVPREHALLRAAREQLGEYFAGKRKEFHLPLATIGTAFQQRVWQQLQTIAYESTRSYREQAREMGDPKAVRAVATANGANYRSIVIPCHRVIGSDGSMTGYGGGVERKKWLLGLERGATAICDIGRR